MDGTLSLLEQKYAMYILLAVKDNPGFTKTEIAKLDGDYSLKTKYLRINEMIQFGLMETDDTNRKFNSMRLFLTPRGMLVAKRIEELKAEMPHVECDPDKYGIFEEEP